MDHPFSDANDCNHCYPAILALDRLHLMLSLGVTEEERKVPQSVHLYLRVFFPTLPPSCLNDKLDDTICYDKIVQQVQEYCRNKEFRLLEYVCFQLHTHLRSSIDPSIKLWLKIVKCNPPIKDMEGPTSFSYGDM